jgi:CTP:phosphocholine cytidylyltransferase-like protein/thiamine kinase-like enzyme
MKVDNAIILAAGFGSRFVPLTFTLPKGLIPVKGTPMIERQIQQLKEKGVNEIIIVVGYLKEKFDYLIDKYGIKLIYNPEYAAKNNLASLYYARNYLKNTYILSADNWIESNIFSSCESKSWYSCVYKQGLTSEWCLRFDDDGRINHVAVGGENSWVMYGPVFFNKQFSDIFSLMIKNYYNKPGTEEWFWENVFIEEIEKLDLYIRKDSDNNIYEFENLEELRQFDFEFGNNTQNRELAIIADVFNIQENEISGIKNIKAGMTNRTFRFIVNEEAYLFRLPGEGTEKLIDRKREKAVYELIKPLHISDEIIYFSETGYKITKYYEGAINTNARNNDDVMNSMDVLRSFHKTNIIIDFNFDIDAEIQRYILLCEERNCVRFTDYMETYNKIKQIIAIIKKINISNTLCHIDSNPDNFIKLSDNTLKLIDWEYAGMADPLIDVAMYAIYSCYSKEEADKLLNIYLGRIADNSEAMRLYAYMSLGGYLWAMWTEYKQSFGVEFGEYGMNMYRYAKEYYYYCMNAKKEMS